MNVETVDFLTIPTRDVERAVSFYTEVLGLGVCHMGFFEDPDGNTVILHRRYAPRG